MPLFVELFWQQQRAARPGGGLWVRHQAHAPEPYYSTLLTRALLLNPPDKSPTARKNEPYYQQKSPTKPALPPAKEPTWRRAEQVLRLHWPLAPACTPMHSEKSILFMYVCLTLQGSTSRC